MQKVTKFILGNKVQQIIQFKLSKYYIQWRVITALLSTLGICWTFNSHGNNTANFFLPFVYLTIWGMTCTWLYFSCSLIMIGWKGAKDYRGINLIYQIAFSLQLAITLIYWTLLFPLIQKKSLNYILININQHLIPLLLIWLEFLFSSIKIRKRSIKIIAIMSFSYMLVNFLYSLIVQPVYPIITFKDFMSYVYGLIGIGLIFAHYIFGIWVTKKIKLKQSGQDYSNLQDV